MTLRRFFSNQTWWGKLLGAFLGYLMAGPVGAMFGILIGNFFDRGLTDHLTNPLWHYHAESRALIKPVFSKALFSIMGHIAKADGRVSELEIQMAKRLMQDMKFNRLQQKEAQQFFNEGKKDQFKLKPMLGLLYKACQDNPNLLKLFIDTQYTFAQVDGLSDSKIQILNTILAYMQRAPLNEQSRFNQDFYDGFTRQRTSGSNHHRTHAPPPHALDQAYSILQIERSANKQEIKRAYRRLISRHHPDKLIAKGMPDYKIKEANAMTQKISKAYEDLLRAKGW